MARDMETAVKIWLHSVIVRALAPPFASITCVVSVNFVCILGDGILSQSNLTSIYSL